MCFEPIIYGTYHRFHILIWHTFVIVTNKYCAVFNLQHFFTTLYFLIKKRTYEKFKNFYRPYRFDV